MPYGTADFVQTNKIVKIAVLAVGFDMIVRKKRSQDEVIVRLIPALPKSRSCFHSVV